MNIVSIDPSLTCTAMVVNDKKFVYTTSTVAHTKKRQFKRWFELCNLYATIRVFDEIPENLNHSESELKKLEFYNKIVSRIVDDICDNCNPADPISIAIEGYSYSSASGPLIDLVTFSTLLRKMLHINMMFAQNELLNINVLNIYQPTEVKHQAAKLTYPEIKKGKKIEYRNNQGVAGGSFKKPEIYKALIENSNLTNDPWVIFLNENSTEILDMKSVPKPIEDINDAKILYEIVKSAVNLNK